MTSYLVFRVLAVVMILALPPTAGCRHPGKSDVIRPGLEMGIGRRFFASGSGVTYGRFDMTAALLADNPVHNVARYRVRTISLDHLRRCHDDPSLAGKAYPEEVAVRGQVIGQGRKRA